jgi:hypothetical protein
MPHPPPAQPVVAIFDSTDETIEMLARLLEEHGCQTVIGRIEEIQSGVGSLGTGGLARALAISQELPAVVVVVLVGAAMSIVFRRTVRPLPVLAHWPRGRRRVGRQRSARPAHGGAS